MMVGSQQPFTACVVLLRVLLAVVAAAARVLLMVRLLAIVQVLA
jgi:hypothetical protein